MRGSRNACNNPIPPFIFGSTGDSRFVGDKQSYSLYARVKEDQILYGLEAMLSEVFQARDHGFTPTELDRVKKNHDAGNGGGISGTRQD